MTDLAHPDLMEAAAARSLSGVIVSRATWLADTTGVTQVPVVGGKTVWEAVPDPTGVLFVVEKPNFFGRFDLAPPEGAAVMSIDRPWSGPEDARHLARSLAQIPGVRLPHKEPETDVFIVSLPGPAEATAGLLSAAGFAGSTALGRRFPEFPGGLRVQVAWSRQENPRFCSIVRAGV
ncbi:MAG: hypothetical protein GY926_26605 [bacterium]|nr:hypothetical protein [bacterium]MCP4968786.1 hypothetical protein [bacterium]